MWRKGVQQEQRSWGARGHGEVCDTHARLQTQWQEPRSPVLGLQRVSSGMVHPYPGAELQAETGAPDKAPIKSCFFICSYFMQRAGQSPDGWAGPLSPSTGKWAPCKGLNACRLKATSGDGEEGARGFCGDGWCRASVRSAEARWGDLG